MINDRLLQRNLRAALGGAAVGSTLSKPPSQFMKLSAKHFVSAKGNALVDNGFDIVTTTTTNMWNGNSCPTQCANIIKLVDDIETMGGIVFTLSHPSTMVIGCKNTANADRWMGYGVAQINYSIGTIDLNTNTFVLNPTPQRTYGAIGDIIFARFVTTSTIKNRICIDCITNGILANNSHLTYTFQATQIPYLGISMGWQQPTGHKVAGRKVMGIRKGNEVLMQDLTPEALAKVYSEYKKLYP